MCNWDDMTPKERRKYINQDQVPLREFNGPSYDMFSNEDNIWPTCSKSYYRVIYEMHFLDDRDIRDITFHIKLSESQIYHIINKLKNNYVNVKNKRAREIIRLHFIDKVRVTKIAKEVGVAHSYVSKVISQYLVKFYVI